MENYTTLLLRAARTAEKAARACKHWEDGGDPGPVSDTAFEADGAILEAVIAVSRVDPSLPTSDYPETRLGRLVLAGRLLVLAGIDEHGRSEDLEMAAFALKLARLS